jgi:hypothetical protein
MGEIDLNEAERRSEPRLNIGNEAVLVDLGDGRGKITCCIWDISAIGACLMVPPDLSMPHTFKILLETGARNAVVVWRHVAHVGIKFVE